MTDKYRCTICDATIEAGETMHCARGPCPMELIAPTDPLLADYGVMLRDRVALAVIAGTLANPTAYTTIAHEAVGRDIAPGRILIDRAFEWADYFIEARKRK